VLVNEHSASAAEIVSGSLKDNHRALIVGARTYGKGSVQEVIPLDESRGELKLTVAYYYLPSGRLVHRKKDATDWGVEPQIIVPMDEDGERKVLQMHVVQETVRKPIPRPTTNNEAGAPTTEPVAAPVDIQLQQGINTMVGLIVLQSSQPPASMAPGEMTNAEPGVTEPVDVTPTAPPANPPASPPSGAVPATLPKRHNSVSPVPAAPPTPVSPAGKGAVTPPASNHATPAAPMTRP